MAQEAFFSLPNLFWFAAGAGLEVFFLGLGVSPTGMALGTDVGEFFGIMEPFEAAASGGEVVAGATPSVASTGLEVLNF